MTADAAAVALVLIAAPPATAAPIMYMVRARRTWWRDLLSWALMTSLWGLALLIDISLLYQWLGDDYWLRDVVRLTVCGLIAAGAWLTAIAMAYEFYVSPRRK